MFDVKKIRNDFPILQQTTPNGVPIIYLDNAATTQRPQQVIDAVSDYFSKENANVHRGIHYLSEIATEHYEKAHEKAAKFIGADGIESMVFTRNTSESLNLLAYSLGLNTLQKGDKIVVSEMEHHSNLVPWQFIARKTGATLDFIEVTPDGFLSLESAERVIDDHTKIVSLVHVSNVLGTINPVKTIGELAHERGATFIVDGAQSVPHMKVNVKDIDADFYAFSGHKMLGPMGIGGLYGKPELFEKMEPFLFGGDMISIVDFHKATWNKLPWKFEAGTPNVNGGVGLLAAIEYLETIGMDQITAWEKELVKYAYKRLEESNLVDLYGPPPDQRAAVISFNLKGIHAHDVASILDEDGIAIRAGHHCVQPLLRKFGLEATARASFYLYNTKEEVDALLESLQKAHDLFNSLS